MKDYKAKFVISMAFILICTNGNSPAFCLQKGVLFCKLTKIFYIYIVYNNYVKFTINFLVFIGILDVYKKVHYIAMKGTVRK